MKLIESSNNEFVKKVAKLKHKKYRDMYGVFCIEGERGVQEALKHRERVQSIVLSSKIVDRQAELVHWLTTVNIECRIVQDDVFGALCDTVNNQGMLAIVYKPSNVTVDIDILASNHKHCLYLDRVADPGNMGAILRTARATGFGLVWVNNCVDVYSPKVVRSAASGLFGLDVRMAVDILQIKRHYSVVCTTPIGDNIYDSSVVQLPKGNKCLVIGNEANGIRQAILETSNYNISLPMLNDLESLNAAVAASVIMYKLAFDT
ncbi:MAG: RNA methyltransferase [Clostridiales bacterium]|nr:RNA methyltransferase [Clostridiales bacterium]